MLRRNVLREVKKSLARYMAIFAIVALGVGFFSGLKVCKEAMVSTGDKYLAEVNFYDFQGISTLGYEEEDVTDIASLDFVTEAEGSISLDVMFDIDQNQELVFKTLSMPKSINLPRLSQGRMPTSGDECLLDDKWTDIEDMIGKTLIVSQDNDEDTPDTLKYREYKIVGLCSSPLYMNYERGTTSVGSGSVSGFVYLGDGGLDTEVFTSIYTVVDQHQEIYSQAYEDKIDLRDAEMEEAFRAASQNRYNRLLYEYQEEYDKEVAEKREEVIQEAIDQAGDLSAYGAMADSILGNIREEAGAAFDEELGEMPDPPFDEPRTYILDREANVGYICFDNDTSIVDSIAKVFPVFFFIVAALVCMTSMTRMVDEQRTQIGVLKALGYSNLSILSTYLFYSGSASLMGGILGFFGGSLLFPYVIWRAYTMMYDFADQVEFVINPVLGIATIAVALVCTMGATLFSCLSDTREVPAELIRPKSPNPGKRILMERITPLWNRISFLHKVSLRNIFRYKKRFLMMIIGISGCTSLLVAGFGIRDSISNVAEYQYSEICLYDYDVVFDDGLSVASRDVFTEQAKEEGRARDVLFCEQLSMNYQGNAGNPLRLTAVDFDELPRFIDLHYRGEKLPAPGDGEIIISESFAQRHELNIGDLIKLQDDDMNTSEFVVSAICENYIYNYGYVTPATFEAALDRPVNYNTAFVVTDIPRSGDEDFLSPDDRSESLNRAAAEIRQMDDVSSVALADEFRNRIANMMRSLNSIVYVVVASAGALAFIVIYNLTNINITERIREIATIKVLGFYPGETSAYVFRENLFLTAIGGLIGLILGKYLHLFIMNEIKVDMISFPINITGLSYFLSLVLTFVFAAIVMFVLYYKLKRISMTESLKTVE